MLLKIIPFDAGCMCHIFYSTSFFFCCSVYSEKTWVGRDMRIRMLNVVNTIDKKYPTVLIQSIHTRHSTIFQQKKSARESTIRDLLFKQINHKL